MAALPSTVSQHRVTNASFSLPPSRILITTRDECELNGRKKLERKRASFIHSFLSPQSGSSSARPAVGTRCRQRRGSEGNRFDPPSQVVEKYTERDWDRRLVINEIHWYGWAYLYPGYSILITHVLHTHTNTLWRSCNGGSDGFTWSV